jgi:hypothetical protein
MYPCGVSSSSFVRADLVVGYKFLRSWSTELDCGVIWNSFDKYGDRLDAFQVLFAPL